MSKLSGDITPYPVAEARKGFSDLLVRAGHGEVIGITHHGHTKACVVSEEAGRQTQRIQVLWSVDKGVLRKAFKCAGELVAIQPGEVSIHDLLNTILDCADYYALKASQRVEVS